MTVRCILGIALISIVVIWAVASYTAVRIVFARTFGRTGWENYPERPDYSYFQKTVSREPVSFPSGKNTLRGYIYGKEKTNGLIVFSHGILCGHEYALPFIAALVDRGWTVFAFDNTGAAASDGRNGRGLVQGALDLYNALVYIDTVPELAARKRFLVGHSQGGYSVCAVLNLYKKVDGVVSLSGFTYPFAVTAEMGRASFGKIIALTDPMIRFEYRRLFGKYAELSAVDGINSCDIPVLIMHGTGDTFVNYHGAGLINHKDEITNTHVTYFPMNYAGRAGHNDFFLTADAQEYSQKQQDALNALMVQYGVKDRKQLPKNVSDNFYAGIDKLRISACNTELADTVDEYMKKY